MAELSPVRWGIVGTGTIAAKLAAAIQQTEGAELVAIGSRSRESAESFARARGVQRAHGSYAELVADALVDVVYVATPHTMHREHTRLAHEAGKAVLCEKPLAVNAAQAADMVAFARQRGCFLMEAMWTRCLPAIRRALELVQAGAIGEPRLLTADFGFASDPDDTGIVFDRALGGGALLDVGVYPIALAFALLGRPVAATGVAHLGPEGVDESQACVLRFESGALAMTASAIRTETPQDAVLSGTAGSLRIHAPFWAATRLTLTDGAGVTTEEQHDFLGNGYVHEVAEVGRCVRAFEAESPLLPLDESVAILETADSLRAVTGPRYPADESPIP